MLTATTTAITLTAAVPAHAVPSMSFVTATTASDFRLGRTHAAHCPIGRRVLGGGAYVGGGATEVHIDGLMPVTTAGGDSFHANATVVQRPDGTGWRGSWFLVVYAICGAAPAGLQYVSASSAGGFTTYRTVTASCPAGKRVIGAAGRVTPGFGFAMLDQITPTATLTDVVVTGYESAAPAALAWRVDAFAICANPLPGQVLISATSPTSATPYKSAVVLCPTGTRIHGLGHDLTGTTGLAGATAVFPDQPLTSAKLTAAAAWPGLSSSWRARVFAICAA
jgi:hypothetical protein